MDGAMYAHTLPRRPFIAERTENALPSLRWPPWPRTGERLLAILSRAAAQSGLRPSAVYGGLPDYLPPRLPQRLNRPHTPSPGPTGAWCKLLCLANTGSRADL